MVAAKDFRAPATISAEIASAAAVDLSRLDAALAAESKPAAVRQWLARLGVLCTSKMSADEAESIVREYVAVLKYPACCYTESSLDAIARKCKWFPSYAELCDALDAELHRLKTIRAGLAILAKPTPSPAQIEPPKRVDPAKMAALATGLRKATPPKRQKPDRSDFERKQAEVLEQCKAAGMLP